jgi:hypothetical protein
MNEVPKRRIAVYLGGALGALAAGVGAVIGARTLMRAMRIGLGFARFWYGLFTLQLTRRCPDCRRLIHGDARVCRHCGWRYAGRRA